MKQLNLRQVWRSRLLITVLAACSLAMQGPSVVKAADTAVAAPAASALTIQNGSMAGGADVPTGWGGKFGDVEVKRDTDVYKEKPASLRVTIAGGKNGQAFQTLQGGAGVTIKVSGWIKSAGAVKAQALVQAFSEGYKQNQFIQLQYLQGDIDWTHFEKEVTLPPWTSFFNVGIMADGEGKAWLDDVTLTASEAPEAQISYTIRDFGPAGFDYAYGPDWKLGQNVTIGADGPVGYAQVDSTEHGGAGVVLNGANLTPQGQNEVVLRARLLPGNAAGTLAVNLVRAEGAKSISFDLSKLNTKDFVTLTQPLGEGKFDNVQQVQVQGTNWSAAAQPLKIQIDKLGTASASGAANTTVQPAAAPDPSTGPPAAGKPNEPGWGFYPNFPQAWQATHNGFLQRTKKGNIPVLFLGDSITQGWTGGGKEVWDKRYAPLNAEDYGMGGDSTRQVLWRIEHGEFDGISPKLIVLMIGTNNLYGDFNAGTDEEIARGIGTIVKTLRAKLPTTRILLMGILPRQNAYFSGRIRNINAIISKLDDGNAVRFLDMGTKFAKTPGQGNVLTDLFVADQLHINAKGYAVWADTMQPLFDQMLAAAPLVGGAAAGGTAAGGTATGATPTTGPTPAAGTAVTPPSPGGTTGTATPTVTPDATPPVLVTEPWEPMPMVRQDILDAGKRPGGEGCQYPQTICMDSIDGSFLLYGTDVGGIFRSIDGGMTFLSCNMGYSAVGACGFAMDPKNLDRCLAVGDNSGNDYYQYDGIYLSTDRGASWKQVLPKLNKGSEKAREQIAYDPSSFDAGLGFCKTAYWSEEGNGKEPGGRLYKTADGGATWTEVAQGPAYGGGKINSLLKIHPVTGAVYLANDSGFYKSTDGGATFTRKMQGDFTSLDVVPSLPDNVILATRTALYRSTDAGEHFTPVPFTGVDGLYRVKISPADPKRMIAQNPRNGERYYSVDAGLTWRGSQKDMQNSWIPPEILYNDRARLVVWHPTNADLAWGIGPGDIISKTLDHGITFKWANNGNNGIMIGGLFNFNTQNPNVLYIGSQDYNGALTANGGHTWQFINLSKDSKDGDPWGWVYGAYAANEKILFGGNHAYNENTMNLWITFDGGRTTMQKVANLTGAQVSYGDPTDPAVLFCWSQRSADRGETWAPMQGCDGVFTSNPKGTRELYGRNGKDIVRSRDKGVTWQVVVTLPTEVRDVAYDGVHDRLFAAAGNSHVYRCDGPAYTAADINDRLPKDQHGDTFQASSVAVDPVVPDVVYAAANGTGLFFQRNNGVARSVDGGETWERLTCNPVHGMVTGGQMASAIRVHPQNRYAYVGTDCYGMWRIAPPRPASRIFLRTDRRVDHAPTTSITAMLP